MPDTAKNRSRGGRRTGGSTTPTGTDDTTDTTADTAAAASADPDVSTTDDPTTDDATGTGGSTTGGATTGDGVTGTGGSTDEIIESGDAPANMVDDAPADVVDDVPDELDDADAAADGVAVPDAADPSGGTDAPVGWADAVPWLALRWGSTPTAAELRYAPVVWRMLQDRPGRTALQMAADAELAGYAELDPSVLTRVLTRYEKAGVVRAATDGRLSWWSVVDPAEIVAEAIATARAGASAAATRPGTRSATVTARTTGAGRSPAGGLRGMVEDHLSEHPFEDFTPGQVAKTLGRSSGAVANALERLTETGVAIQTSMSPRRYQHRPDPDTDTAPGTDPTDDASDTTTANGADDRDGAAE